MAILEIIEAPHPVLSAKARKVNDSEFGADMYRFLQDMAETMYAAPGVGLAAPQVGDGRRIIVADPGNDDEQAERRLYMMVNPTIVEKSKKTIRYEESCLSVPEYSVMVKRHKRIKVAWQDAFGKFLWNCFGYSRTKCRPWSWSVGRWAPKSARELLCLLSRIPPPRI